MSNILHLGQNKPKKGQVRVLNFPVVVSLFRHGAYVREHWVTWGVALDHKAKQEEIEAIKGFIRQFLPDETLVNSKGEQVKCQIHDPITEMMDTEKFN